MCRAVRGLCVYFWSSGWNSLLVKSDMCLYTFWIYSVVYKDSFLQPWNEQMSRGWVRVCYSGAQMCACLVYLSLLYQLKMNTEHLFTSPRGPDADKHSNSIFQHAECIHVCHHVTVLTHFGVTNTLTLGYAYFCVVWSIKNALGSRAIMMALPVVNNTYLMESNTDYCKLFNCILIPQDPIWRERVTRKSLTTLKILSHVARCAWVWANSMWPQRTLHYKCDSSLTLVILEVCVIFTEHSFTLLFF